MIKSLRGGVVIYVAVLTLIPFFLIYIILEFKSLMDDFSSEVKLYNTYGTDFDQMYGLRVKGLELHVALDMCFRRWGTP